MIQTPIYKPSGRAQEYCEYACNIYTGCPHRCYYCFAPDILHKTREDFHTNVQPRKDIVESVVHQLKREKLTGQLIQLCFTCDPYPAGIGTTPTREVIKAIKASGNFVQILTKGGMRAVRDFDLLGDGDWFGVTMSGNLHQMQQNEPSAADFGERLVSLKWAKDKGINTWMSCEPVHDTETVYRMIADLTDFVDMYRIGKLNYHPSDINWGEFGRECERLCKEYGRNYYIKDDLKKCMED